MATHEDYAKFLKQIREQTGIDSLRQAEADLDMNGTFNANDASLLLRYAALFGSSNFTGTIEEYIHR